MDKYINANKLRMHIVRINHNPDKVTLTNEEKEKFLKMLDEVHTANVKPNVKGKWHIDAEGNVRCTVCKTKCLRDDIGINILSNYCPNCGADMRGEE